MQFEYGQEDALRTSLLMRGYSCKLKKGEVVLETCHLCGNAKWNLELNLARNDYYCWACRQGGRLHKLLAQLLGESVHVTQVDTRLIRAKKKTPLATEHLILIDPGEYIPAVKHLERRGLPLSTAKQYGITVCWQTGHPWHGRLVVPMLTWGGEQVGYIARSLSGAQPKYLSSVPRGVVTGWRSHEAGAPYVIVEGPFDGLAVHRAGAHAIVLGGLALGGETLQQWAARLVMQGRTPRMFVCLDGDEAGQRQAQRLLWSLHEIVPGIKNLTLPAAVDPADVLPHVLRQWLDHHLPHHKADSA